MKMWLNSCEKKRKKKNDLKTDSDKSFDKNNQAQEQDFSFLFIWMRLIEDIDVLKMANSEPEFC